MTEVPLSASACANCGAEAPEDARFCPHCGTRLGGSGSPREDSPSSPTTVARADRRVYGLAPPELLFAIALVIVSFAVYFLASGRLIAGFALLALAIGAGAYFVSTARRQPEGRLVQIATSVSDEARGRAGFAWTSLSSWSWASREVVRLRSRQLRLRREQSELIRALGDAVYSEQGDLAEELKAEARGRAEQIDECARELEIVREAARQRVERERLAIQPTQVVHAGEQADGFGSASPEGDRNV